MIEKKEIQEFKEHEFVQAVQLYWKDTEEKISHHLKEHLEYTQNTISEVFTNIAVSQKKRNLPAGQIVISLIRNSVWNGKARAKIEVYDKNQVLGKLICTQDMDVSWMFVSWNFFHETIVRLAEEKGVSRYIREPVIRWLMESKLTEMAYYLYALLKYITLDADQLPAYDLFERRDGFYMSVGEYQDWQKIIYAEMPVLDILYPNEAMPFIFQKIDGQKFCGIHFENLNLEKARFTNCEFERCTFTDVNLNDVRFIDCSIRDMKMLTGTMYGALFQRCYIEDMDLTGMQRKWKPFSNPEPDQDFYRQVLMTECKVAGEEDNE